MMIYLLIMRPKGSFLERIIMMFLPVKKKLTEIKNKGKVFKVLKENRAISFFLKGFVKKSTSPAARYN